MNGQAPIEIYQSHIKEYEQQCARLKKKRITIAWIRFLVAAATITTVKLLWHEDLWIIFAAAGAGIACFLYAVSIDTDAKAQLQNFERLITINQEEIKILANDFLHREDGKQFEINPHAYAQDLDIFGTASIYQYLNRCTAERGKELLAKGLLQPSTKEGILLKQAAVKELVDKLQWCQQLQSFGMEQPVTLRTEKKIKDWLQQRAIFSAPSWKWIAYIFPIVSLTTVFLFLNDTIPQLLFYILLFIFFLFAFSLSKKIHKTWLLLSKIVPEVDTLYHQLNFIESENFGSTYISSIKKSIQSNDAIQASKEILQLKNILNRFDVRLNVFAFYILNTLLLWDLWQVLALNNWKAKNQNSVAEWFTAIAEVETLSSSAALAFNQPAWCYPTIADKHFTLQATTLGHPLIAAGKRVNNDYQLAGTGKVSIITGSNMGGKSTFLRSMGVNIVLALMGSPVCADSFTVSSVMLMSSMRIADNLAESTSTFYAELKKLKSIIDAVNNNEKIFILLDEILRGTNSLDRHTGSKALIKQLIQRKAVAVAATHDVELAKLETGFPQAISNYHFDVQVENEELYFDYKLKPGICTSLNASILMKKIGIELVD